MSIYILKVILAEYLKVFIYVHIYIEGYSSRVSEGSIRLVDGGSNREGRVEIFIQDHWHTICDDYWDDSDASVICKNQGYITGTARSSAYFGRGVGEIAMDNIACSGYEYSLTSCSHNGFFDHNCGHSEDAGVTCSCKLEVNI